MIYYFTSFPKKYVLAKSAIFKKLKIKKNSNWKRQESFPSSQKSLLQNAAAASPVDNRKVVGSLGFLWLNQKLVLASAKNGVSFFFSFCFVIFVTCVHFCFVPILK